MDTFKCYPSTKRRRFIAILVVLIGRHESRPYCKESIVYRLVYNRFQYENVDKHVIGSSVD